MAIEFASYEKIIKRHPEFKGVITPDSWNYIDASNKNTNKGLADLWRVNTRRNIENNLWRKHGSLKRDCLNLGKNKSVIGVGAGPSFKKNQHVLERIAATDGRKSWEDRDFMIIASNHQFKPLLKMGILPDFVMLADASEDVLPQLTEDIPREGRNVTLISTLAASPRVLKRWSRQGREIRFYIPGSESSVDEFRKVAKQDPEPHTMLVGGNVLNCMFLLGLAVFGSSSFMALGNDLSYLLDRDVEKRRETYYADGDYQTTQMQDGRDEAKNAYKWMGFKLSRPLIYTGKGSYNVELSLVGTTHNLWVYKTWIEAWAMANMNRTDLRWHYYNCSEGGMLGVMSRAKVHKSKNEDWYMLDEVCPRWHTMMFEDAVRQFQLAKEVMRWPGGEIPIVARNAGNLVQKRMEDITRNVNSGESRQMTAYT